jgi:hypothetical protein
MIEGPGPVEPLEPIRVMASPVRPGAGGSGSGVLTSDGAAGSAGVGAGGGRGGTQSSGGAGGYGSGNPGGTAGGYLAGGNGGSATNTFFGSGGGGGGGGYFGGGGGGASSYGNIPGAGGGGGGGSSLLNASAVLTTSGMAGDGFLAIVPQWPPSQDAGGGVVTGNVTFSGAGVPPASSQTCAPTSFAFTGAADGFILNTVGTEYAGPVTLTGSGGSICETASHGDGPLTISAAGQVGTGSSVSCPNLVGSFIRVLTQVTALVSGTCTVNGYATASVTFVGTPQFVPTDGGGATTPIRNAQFAGPFSVLAGS